MQLTLQLCESQAINCQTDSRAIYVANLTSGRDRRPAPRRDAALQGSRRAGVDDAGERGYAVEVCCWHDAATHVSATALPVSCAKRARCWRGRTATVAPGRK